MIEKDIASNPNLFHRGSGNHAVLILHGFTIELGRTDLLYKFLIKKGFTVARPVLPGHDGDLEELKRNGPDEWFNEAKRWFDFLAKDYDSISIIGVSFGANLAVTLASGGSPKIKGLVLMEMPIFFRLRMRLMIHCLQPILELFGIGLVKKSSLVYRRNYSKSKSSFSVIPVRAVGGIRRYIVNKTKHELEKLTIPVFVLQAENSDLLNNKRITKYICDKVSPDKRKIYCVPIDNHDLNLLDDEGKAIMLEKINDFICSCYIQRSSATLAP